MKFVIETVDFEKKNLNEKTQIDSKVEKTIWNI